MKSWHFHTWDVFSDRQFGGNPLAIFEDATGLTDAQMQSIAAELNLSETVFVFPDAPDGGIPIRIFTPGREVPFAGHPTVGTACFLATSGRIGLTDGVGEGVLHEGVGPVPVRVRCPEGAPPFARLTTAVRPTVDPVSFDLDEAAEMLGLDPIDLEVDLEGEPALPAFASTGLAFLIVPVRDVAAAGRARLDARLRDQLLPDDAPSRMIYIVAPGGGDGVDLHVRMFAPEIGVPEDPATGSAAAALGGYLGTRLAEGLHRRIIEQGVEMGRPSRIELEMDIREGRVAEIAVGGHAVPVTQGTFTMFEPPRS